MDDIVEVEEIAQSDKNEYETSSADFSTITSTIITNNLIISAELQQTKNSAQEIQKNLDIIKQFFLQKQNVQ